MLSCRFNIRTGSPRSRYLMTGMHTISDVVCNICDCVLGWKYVRAVLFLCVCAVKSSPRLWFVSGRLKRWKRLRNTRKASSSWKRHLCTTTRMRNRGSGCEEQATKYTHKRTRPSPRCMRIGHACASLYLFSLSTHTHAYEYLLYQQHFGRKLELPQLYFIASCHHCPSLSLSLSFDTK